ncbi:MAG: hypothetical protein ACYC6Y_16790 [Thermoguttaceae bacterium]
MRDATIAGQEALLIGVPVIRNNHVLGVVEVLQRAGITPAMQKGYLRCVGHLATLVAEYRGLSA